MTDLTSAEWRKSSHSANGACVEIAFIGRQVAVRDSKAREGVALIFSFEEWEAFIRGARDGEFDLD